MVTTFAPYKSILDPADTLFAANFLLSYFSSAKDAPELMRLQKVADLKSKDLWDSKDSFSNYFRPDEVIDPSNPNFGINV